MSTEQIYNLNYTHAGNYSLIVADSAESRLIHELRGRGLNIIEAEKGAGSITAGISLLWDYEIIVDPESHNLIREFTNYSWQDKTNKSIPQDKFNHGIDALRYFVFNTLRDPHRGKYYIG